MTIPSRPISYPPPPCYLRAQNQVFEDFVDGMANVDGAVGVRRSVVQDEIPLNISGLSMIRAMAELPGVQVIGATATVALQGFGGGACRERGGGKVEGVGP